MANIKIFRINFRFKKISRLGLLLTFKVCLIYASGDSHEFLTILQYKLKLTCMKWLAKCVKLDCETLAEDKASEASFQNACKRNVSD